MNEQEKIYQLALSMINGVGFQLWHSFIEHFGTATNLYQESKSTLKNIYKYKNIVDDILEKKHVKEAENLFLIHSKNSIKIISFFEEEYPYRLKQINNPPCFLYIKGNNNLSHQRIISIIGTRYPSIYGKDNVEMFVRSLQEYNVLILSGLAYGIDILAHKNALKYNINTSAMVAGGIDKLYPAEHKTVCDKIIQQNGAIISEYPLGTNPNKFYFPARNRIIAGCSDAILIIEAGQKSGTMITAMCANDFNRDVFAIPGNIGNEKSIGCNNLIKNNMANLVTCIDDVTKIMDWNKSDNNIRDIRKEIDTKDKKLNKNSKKVFEIIKKQKIITIDELSLITNIDVSQLLPILLTLEIEGFIQNLPGNKYKTNNIF